MSIKNVELLNVKIGYPAIPTEMYEELAKISSSPQLISWAREGKFYEKGAVIARLSVKSLKHGWLSSKKEEATIVMPYSGVLASIKPIRHFSYEPCERQSSVALLSFTELVEPHQISFEVIPSDSQEAEFKSFFSRAQYQNKEDFFETWRGGDQAHIPLLYWCAVANNRRVANFRRGLLEAMANMGTRVELISSDSIKKTLGTWNKTIVSIPE